jgi:hypothetical protein
MTSRYKGVAIIWILLQLLDQSWASYRYMPIDTADMCSEKFPNQHKKISIGTGAIILELSKPRIAFHSSRERSKLCEIHVNAPDGFGILAFVEDAYLRQNSSDKQCKDYIQFGQDDSVPLVTLVKSSQICGRVDGRRDVNKGFMYDDPYGNLLIWVNLWGRKGTSHWPAIYTVNLTLVLTAYQSNCGTKKTSTAILNNVQPPGPGFSWCGVDPGPCISKDYFCDQRFNCLADKTSNKTYDEVSCQYDESKSVTTKEENLDEEGNDEDSEQDLVEIAIDPNSLNTISWILIIICSCIGIVLVMVLAVGCMKNTFCHGGIMASGGSFDNDCLNIHERHLAQLSANRSQTAEQNVYIPLENLRGVQPSEDQAAPQEPQQEALVPEEPPPSYDTLFPPTNNRASASSSD